MKMQKISDSDLYQLRKRACRDKSGLLAHLLDCYQTVFENACDETKDTLEFKPEILEAIEFEQNHICENSFKPI